MDKENNLLWTEHQMMYASDVDFQSIGKLSSLLDIMQRAADSAVSGLGVSIQDMLEAGMGWMLITLDLDIRRMPRQNDALSVRTWSKGTKGPMWQRDYRIFNDSSEEIAVARSIWALVDIQKRRILRPTALPVKVEHYTGDSVGNIPDKVVIPEGLPMEEVYRYQVRYSGLDTNGHLNNARYGDLCCDVLSLKEWEGRELTSFKITYLQEAKFGDEITVFRSSLIDDMLFVRGQAGAQVLFEASMELGN